MQISKSIIFNANSKPLYTCQISQDDETLFATAGYDKNIYVYETSPPYNLHLTLSSHTNYITSLKWKAEAYILSTSVDTTAILWNVATGTVDRKFKSHKNIVHCCDISDNLAATCGDDAHLLVWDRRVKDYVLTLQTQCPLTACLIRKDERSILFGGIDGSVTEYSLQNQAYARIIPKQPVGLYYINEAESEALVAVSQMDNSLLLYQKAPNGDYKLQHALRQDPKPAEDTSFVKSDLAPNGGLISSGNSETLTVWEASTGRVFRSMKSPVGSISQVAFSRTSQHISLCGSNGTACIIPLGS